MARAILPRLGSKLKGTIVIKGSDDNGTLRFCREDIDILYEINWQGEELSAILDATVATPVFSMDMPVTLWKQNGHLQVENSLTKLKVPLVASDDEEEPLQFNVGEIKAKAVLPVSSINYLVNVVAAYNKYMTHDAKSILRDTVSIEVAINDDSDAVEFYSAASSGAFLCKIQTIDGEIGPGSVVVPSSVFDAIHLLLSGKEESTFMIHDNFLSVETDKIESHMLGLHKKMSHPSILEERVVERIPLSNTETLVNAVKNLPVVGGIIYFERFANNLAINTEYNSLEASTTIRDLEMIDTTEKFGLFSSAITLAQAIDPNGKCEIVHLGERNKALVASNEDKSSIAWMPVLLSKEELA